MARSRIFTLVSILAVTFVADFIGAEIGAFWIGGRFFMDDLHMILAVGSARAIVAATSVLLIPKCRDAWVYWLKVACFASTCYFIPMAWLLVIAIVGI